MTFASKWYIASRFHLRVSFFCFSFAKEKAGQAFGMACLCDKAAGCRFSQNEGEVYRSLSADNGDRGPQARRHCLALSEESAIRLAERASDASRQYHRLPNGQVVSKCALRVIKKAERPGTPRTPQLPSCEFLS